MKPEVETTTTLVHEMIGESSHFTTTIRRALDAARDQDGDNDQHWNILLTGAYGYRVEALFTSNGICERYAARKTGYDGDFRLEGRGEIKEVLSLLEQFFRAGSTIPSGDEPGSP